MAPGLVDATRQSNEHALNVTVPLSKEPSSVVTDISSTPSTPSPTSASPPSTTIPVRHPSLITKEFDLLRFEAAAFDQLPKVSTSQDQVSTEEESTDLISSPYNNPGHYLSLPSLPLSSQLFAKALTALRPVVPDYATAPYTDALNFDDVLRELRHLLQQTTPTLAWSETSFYVVIFRSKLKPDIDNDWLYKLDYESHREACESGGLLKYWFGKSDEVERRNLATCTFFLTFLFSCSSPFFPSLSLLFSSLFCLFSCLSPPCNKQTNIGHDVNLYPLTTGFWHSRADAFQGGLGPWHKKARAAGRELYESIVFSTHRFTVLEGAVGYRFEEWK